MLPNGIIRIIDRKKNLVKLSQGEYIALEYLENVYTITPIVEDVSVYFQMKINMFLEFLSLKVFIYFIFICIDLGIWE